eukprot:14715872-Alexandrium_andersonii.AAC.1
MHQASFYVASAGGASDMGWQTGGLRLARAARSGVNARRAGEEWALGCLWGAPGAVSYTHLRAHETSAHL